MKLIELTQAEVNEMICLAVDQESMCKLTVCIDNRWMVYPTNVANVYFKVYTPCVDGKPVKWPLQQKFEFSARFGHKKLMFMSKIRSVSLLGDKQVIECELPSSAYIVQRRYYHRVSCSMPIHLKVSGVTHSGTTKDISAGGVRVLLDKTLEAEIGQTISCLLRTNGSLIRVESIVREINFEKEQTDIKLQFVSLMHNADRHVINNLIYLTHQTNQRKVGNRCLRVCQYETIG